MHFLVYSVSIFFLCIVAPSYSEDSKQASDFGLGRIVDAVEIAKWDIDVRPDGRGLPKGIGSVEQGKIIYSQKCSYCHGQKGQGGPFDVLVGRIPGDGFPFGQKPEAVKTIGNYWPYATTLFDYINRAMPFNAPGSLQADEVYGLVAYLLYENEIVPMDAILSAKNLAKIIMPARQRFVLDDRRGGSEIR